MNAKGKLTVIVTESVTKAQKEMINNHMSGFMRSAIAMGWDVKVEVTTLESGKASARMEIGGCMVALVDIGARGGFLGKFEDLDKITYYTTKQK